MNVLHRLLIGFVCGGFLSGCATSAAFLAANQPERIAVEDILRPGVPKSNVVARLGAPEVSKSYGSAIHLRTADVYNFTQGYSGFSRTARVFTHSTLSVITIGLWEPAGQAIEGYARGNRVSIEITYDVRERLVNYCVLEGREHIDTDGDERGVTPECPSA